MDLRIIGVGTKEYSDMADLRIKVLLDPIGIPSSYINPEKEAHDILIGAFDEDELIGCCILSHVDETTLQLRQMAVDDTRQKKGIGAAIVAFAEDMAKNTGYHVLMMHARDSVLDFYKKCGYAISGEQFFEVGIGHHQMKNALV